MQALASYILAAFNGKSLGHKAGLKYFLIGSFSSAFVLFGMSLILYTTALSSLMRLELSQSSDMILQGDYQFYNVLVTAHTSN